MGHAARWRRVEVGDRFHVGGARGGCVAHRLRLNKNSLRLLRGEDGPRNVVSRPWAEAAFLRRARWGLSVCLRSLAVFSVDADSSGGPN